MTPEAQRIAIAEACGWHSFREIGGDSTTKLWGHQSQSSTTELVPDYLADLNAMADAVRTLPVKGPLQQYYMWVIKIVGFPYDAIEAAAAQRAEAFLRTLSKWAD